MRQSIIITSSLLLLLFSLNVIASSNLIISPISESEQANVNDTISKTITLRNLDIANNLIASLPQNISFIGAKTNLTLNIIYNITLSDDN